MILLLLTWGLIYFGSAFTPALFDDVDSLNAIVPREMLASGDWVTPLVNGFLRYQKPPMMYWLTLPSYGLFGATEFSARLPSSLMILGTALSIFFLGKLLSSKKTGVLAALFFLLSPGPYLFSRTILPDLFLLFFLTLGFYFFLRGQTENNYRCYIVFSLLMGCAILSKGFLALIFPVLIILAFLFFTRSRKPESEASGQSGSSLGRSPVRHMRLGLLFLVFLAVTIPWHLLMQVRHPQFFSLYIINEHILRFFARRAPVDYHSIPLLIFLPLHLLWLFPWSFFLPWAFRGEQPLPGAGVLKGRAFLYAWIAVVFGFFMISTRLEYYTLPAYPPLLILIAHAVAGWIWAKSPGEAEDKPVPGRSSSLQGWAGNLRPAFLVLLVVGTLIGAAILILLSAHGAPGLANQGGGGDSPSILGSYSRLYFFGPVSGLSLPALLTNLRGTMLAVALLLLAGTALGSVLAHQGRKTMAVASLCLMMGGGMLLAHRGVEYFEPFLSIKSLALTINQNIQPGESVVYDGDLWTGSSLAFYLHSPLHLVHAHPQWEVPLSEEARKRFLEEETLARSWNGNQRVWLVTEHDQVRDGPVVQGQEIRLAWQHPLRAYVVAESGTRLLLSNKSF